MTLRADLAACLERHLLPTEATLALWRDELAAEDRAAAAQWITEDRAQRRSGKSLRWLRRHWRQWAKDGYARKVIGARMYFAAVLPQTRLAIVPSDDAREQARRDAAA